MLKTNLWPRLEQLVRNVERPARYLNHEWGCVYKQRGTHSEQDAQPAPDAHGQSAPADAHGHSAPDAHEQSAPDAPSLQDAHGQSAPDVDFAFCMVYPDTYELGQANQAVRILVNALNATDHLMAERAFLPAADMIDAMRAEGLPLFSLESCAPLSEFDVIGITLPHELAATNVLEVIDLAGIAVRADERANDDPIILAGGPCAYNPEPYAPFFDVFSIGEGEESLPEISLCIRELRQHGVPRADILRALADIPGTYVPSLYRWRTADEAQVCGSWIEPLFEGIPERIDKRVFESFARSSAWEPCVVPYVEAVHDRLNVEILRGCARGCRFCQAGMMYRPIRERSCGNIVDAVLRGLDETGYDEVSLTSLSSTDHSQIAEILTQLNKACEGRGIRVSIPSQRLDAFGVDMATLVAGRKKGGLTFAPEAGTQRLRDVINKNVTEDDLFGAIDAAFRAGWRRCKLYFMVGLPGETDEDIKGIASLAQRAYDRARAAVPTDQRGNVNISVACNVFVPKAQTPFQWDGQIAPEEALRRVGLLKRSVKYRAVKVHYHEPSTSFVEAVMSRGGREVAALVERAWQLGARFDAWTEFFREDAWRTAADELGLNLEEIAQTSYDTGYVMPWSHISAGVALSYLVRERQRASRGETTPDCTFERCEGCGVCQVTGTDNELAAVRRGSVPTDAAAGNVGDVAEGVPAVEGAPAAGDAGDGVPATEDAGDAGEGSDAAGSAAAAVGAADVVTDAAGDATGTVGAAVLDAAAEANEGGERRG